MPRLLLLSLVCMVSGCSPAAPPRELPGYLEGALANNSYPSYLVMQLEQDGARLEGRYEWSIHSSHYDFEGTFEGDTAGDEVRLQVEVPADVVQRYGWPEQIPLNLKLTELTQDEKSQLNPPDRVLFKPEDRVLSLKGSTTFSARGQTMIFLALLTDVPVVPSKLHSGAR
ncbi:MAG: hypothetical protein HY319_11840 [Armatimonadetes bacterium]|nr:hypothetical protein [Armatimonadota bacterium]